MPCIACPLLRAPQPPAFQCRQRLRPLPCSSAVPTACVLSQVGVRLCWCSGSWRQARAVTFPGWAVPCSTSPPAPLEVVSSVRRWSTTPCWWSTWRPPRCAGGCLHVTTWFIVSSMFYVVGNMHPTHIAATGGDVHCWHFARATSLAAHTPPPLPRRSLHMSSGRWCPTPYPAATALCPVHAAAVRPHVRLSTGRDADDDAQRCVKDCSGTGE